MEDTTETPKKKKITTDLIAAMRTDKSNGMTLMSIKDKYVLNYKTVQKYCKGLSTYDVQKEITDIVDAQNRDILLGEMSKQGLNCDYIITKLKEIIDSPNEAMVLKAVSEWFKIHGMYAKEKTEIDIKDAPIVFLPTNKRDES